MNVVRAVLALGVLPLIGCTLDDDNPYYAPCSADSECGAFVCDTALGVCVKASEGEGEGEGEGEACTLFVDERFSRAALEGLFFISENGGAAQMIDGQLELAVPAAAGGYLEVVAPGVFDMSTTAVTVKLTALPPIGAKLLFGAQEPSDITVYDEILIGENALALASDDVPDAPLVWGGLGEPYFRLEGDGDEIVVSVSTDGVAFNERYRRAARPYVNAAQVYVGASYNANHGAYTDRFFDDLRIFRGACEDVCIPAFADELDDGVLPADSGSQPNVNIAESGGEIVVDVPDATQGFGFVGVYRGDLRDKVVSTWLSGIPVGPFGEAILLVHDGSVTDGVRALKSGDSICLQRTLGVEVLSSTCEPFNVEQHVFWQLRFDEEAITLAVSDNGVGFTDLLDFPKDERDAFLSDAVVQLLGGAYQAQNVVDRIAFERVSVNAIGCAP